MVEVQRMISPYNYYRGNSIKYIVIHGTGSPGGTDTAQANAKYFFGGLRGASAHYFIDDISIWQSVEDFNGSWNCGDGANKYGINNQNTLSIEMCCTGYDYGEATLKNTIEFVKKKQLEYNIPNDRVIRHYDASRKICPEYLSGNGWERWYAFLSRLGSTSITVPGTEVPVIPVVGKYLNLLPHMNKWNVYPMNVRPVIGNECGTLSPSTYRGLSYKIIEDRGEVKIINTGFYGTVQIYAPRDNDSTITDNPTYNNGLPIEVPKPVVKNYLNLSPDVPTWRVYGLSVSPIVGNECGKLAPQYYGGLSYEILEDKGDIKIINTSTFGKVQIYAPRDTDSSITSSPLY